MRAMTSRLLKGSVFMAMVASAVLLNGRPSQACEGHEKGAKYHVLEVNQLATIIDSKESVTILDANNTDTRQKFGIVPGAKLLTDAEKYNLSTELPADKTQKLVFYCGGKLCMAAPKAAERAAAAGYTNVYVMKAGIKGWVDAGQKVETVKSKA